MGNQKKDGQLSKEIKLDTISWDDFTRVELRIGRVVSAETFPEARKPAYILHIDFGDEIGVRKSSAQRTDLYQPEELVGKLVVAVVNFPKKQIGKLMSECSRKWLQKRVFEQSILRSHFFTEPSKSLFDIYLSLFLTNITTKPCLLDYMVHK